MNAIINAGGRGTRLLPLTNELPKCLVPIGDIPVIVHQINNLKKAKISEIYIIVNYLSDVIKKVLGDGSRYDIKITYIDEESPLGTAGSLSKMKTVTTDPFMFLYCDYFLNCNINNFIQFYEKRPPDKIGAVVTQKFGYPKEIDHVDKDTDHKIVRLNIRPHCPGTKFKNMASAGIYIFSNNIFQYIQDGVQSFEQDIFPKIVNSRNHSLYGYYTDEYIHDIGTHERLQKVCDDYSANNHHFLDITNAPEYVEI